MGFDGREEVGFPLGVVVPFATEMTGECGGVFHGASGIEVYLGCYAGEESDQRHPDVAHGCGEIPGEEGGVEYQAFDFGEGMLFHVEGRNESACGVAHDRDLVDAVVGHEVERGLDVGEVFGEAPDLEFRLAGAYGAAVAPEVDGVETVAVGVEDAAHGCLEEIVVETVDVQYAASAIE